MPLSQLPEVDLPPTAGLWQEGTVRDWTALVAEAQQVLSLEKPSEAEALRPVAGWRSTRRVSASLFSAAYNHGAAGRGEGADGRGSDGQEVDLTEGAASGSRTVQPVRVARGAAETNAQARVSAALSLQRHQHKYFAKHSERDRRVGCSDLSGDGAAKTSLGRAKGRADRDASVRHVLLNDFLRQETAAMISSVLRREERERSGGEGGAAPAAAQGEVEQGGGRAGGRSVGGRCNPASVDRTVFTSRSRVSDRSTMGHAVARFQHPNPLHGFPASQASADSKVGASREAVAPADAGGHHRSPSAAPVTTLPLLGGLPGSSDDAPSHARSQVVRNVSFICASINNTLDTMQSDVAANMLNGPSGTLGTRHGLDLIDKPPASAVTSTLATAGAAGHPGEASLAPDTLCGTARDRELALPEEGSACMTLRYTKAASALQASKRDVVARAIPIRNRMAQALLYGSSRDDDWILRLRNAQRFAQETVTGRPEVPLTIGDAGNPRVGRRSARQCAARGGAAVRRTETGGTAVTLPRQGSHSDAPFASTLHAATALGGDSIEETMLTHAIETSLDPRQAAGARVLTPIKAPKSTAESRDVQRRRVAAADESNSAFDAQSEDDYAAEPYIPHLFFGDPLRLEVEAVEHSLPIVAECMRRIDTADSAKDTAPWWTSAVATRQLKAWAIRANFHARRTRAWCERLHEHVAVSNVALRLFNETAEKDLKALCAQHYDIDRQLPQGAKSLEVLEEVAVLLQQEEQRVMHQLADLVAKRKADIQCLMSASSADGGDLQSRGGDISTVIHSQDVLPREVVLTSFSPTAPFETRPPQNARSGLSHHFEDEGSVGQHSLLWMFLERTAKDVPEELIPSLRDVQNWLYYHSIATADSSRPETFKAV